MRTHFDCISHHSVNANGGEDERRGAEDSKKQQVEPRLLELAVKVLVDRANVDNRPIPAS